MGMHGERLLTSRADKPLSTMTALKNKNAERELLAVKMLEWEQQNEVTRLPIMTPQSQLLSMRAGEVELIGFKDVCKRWDLKGHAVLQIICRHVWVIGIMQDGQRCYALADIEKIEKVPNFRLLKSII